MRNPKELHLLTRLTAVGEARLRLERLIVRHDALATESYVRYCINAAAAEGFDLLKGDVALVHPDDLPDIVKLVPHRDPVYALAHPSVLLGKMLFVRKNLVEQYLGRPAKVH